MVADSDEIRLLCSERVRRLFRPIKKSSSILARKELSWMSREQFYILYTNPLTYLIPTKVKGLQLGQISNAARAELTDFIPGHIKLLQHELISQEIRWKVLYLIVAHIDHRESLGVIKYGFRQHANLILAQIQNI